MSLSEYERQRLENIKENEALLRTLEIPIVTNSKSSNTSTLRKHKPVVKKERQLPTRTSARIRGKQPTAANEDAKRQLDLADREATPLKKLKTIDALDPEEQAKMLSLMKKTLVPNTEPKKKKQEEVKEEQDEQGRTPDEVLKNQLVNLEIKHTWATVKVTPQRINGCLFHPSDSKLLACAVDVEGHLGFWDIKQETEEGDPIVYTYKPHTRTTTDMHFNPVDNSKLMTSSYDGLIRTFDMNKAEFENLELQGNWPFTSFDIAQDGHSVYFSTSDGDIGFKDIRSQEKELVHQMREKKVGCIHLNPVHNHLLAAASNDRTVTIWDTRMWAPAKAKKKKEYLHDFEHGYSATSCYWSPKGDLLATTSYDDYIRLFTLDKDEMELKSAIKHNNHTGRWVTNFRARWNYNPHQQEKTQHLIIGNMQQPIDIYSASTGNEIMQLYDEDHITAIPSVNAFHPTTSSFTILAGNASGRMVVWE